MLRRILKQKKLDLRTGGHMTKVIDILLKKLYDIMRGSEL